MRLIVYIMIISTSIYDNSKIQGEGEARPQGLCHTTLRTPSRRSVEPIAGGSEFVALTLETVTGGSTRQLSRARFDAHYGNTPRRRTHVHVDCTYARKPSNVTDVSQPGGLRKIVKESLWRNRAALVAAEEARGTRLDAIGATRVMTSRWGADKGRGEVEIGQIIMGDHLVGWETEAPKSTDNAHMSLCTVPRTQLNPDPNKPTHHNPDPRQHPKRRRNGEKKRLRLEKTPICRGRGKPLADSPQGRPFGCRCRPLGSDEDGQCGVCLWTQYRKWGKSGKSGPKKFNNLGGDLFLETTQCNTFNQEGRASAAA